MWFLEFFTLKSLFKFQRKDLFCIACNVQIPFLISSKQQFHANLFYANSCVPISGLTETILNDDQQFFPFFASCITTGPIFQSSSTQYQHLPHFLKKCIGTMLKYRKNLFLWCVLILTPYFPLQSIIFHF